MNDKNYVRLGQIYTFLQKKLNYEANRFSDFELLIGNDFNVNYQLPKESLICKNKPEYSGNTALHVLAERYQDYGFCEFYHQYLHLLIKQGADVTIQNNDGYTPLLLAFSNEGSRINSLSLAYLIGNNTTNIRDKNGISYFHILCTTDQVELIELFLKAGVDINERVNDDSPIYPGYAPIHFALLYPDRQVIGLLMNYGADLNVRDACGISPIHLIIKNPIQKTDLKNSLKMDIFMRNEILGVNLNDLLDNLGFCRLHFGCLIYNHDISKHQFLNGNVDIDTPIKFDSPVWPGRTPLHLATQTKNLNIVILLLKKGADILAKDATGITPLDLIFETFQFDVIKNILSVEKRYQFSKLKLSDGTLLFDAIKALHMEGSTDIEKFLMQKIENVNIFIPFNSPVWPGYNLLHLSVLFDSPKLLRHGLDFTMLNANGMSPLHLAFRLKKKRMVNWILYYSDTITVNPVDRDNLSHLHIACAVFNYDFTPIKYILENGADQNIPTLCDFQWNFQMQHVSNVIKKGSTPLHIAVSKENVFFAENLLSFGANPYMADATGVTPFQLAINKFSSIHGRKQNQFQKLIQQMLKYPGINLVTGDARIYIVHLALSELISNYEKLLRQIVLKFDCRKRYEELGLTRLQLACVIDDSKVIKTELESGADINARIAFDSPLWPGDTALHILLRKTKQLDVDQSVELLLARGADFTLKNAKNQTPFHLNQDYLSQKDTFLLKYNFANINPVNDEGLSHFHISCIKYNKTLIQEFLKSGVVDVNACVDYFSKQYAGYTPLHLVAEYMDCKNMEVIELLLSYGADTKICDASGFVPWHCAMLHNVQSVKLLLRYPKADVYAKNIFGQTSLDTILRTDNSEQLEGRIKKMVQWGYELCHKDDHGRTALHKSEDSHVIHILLRMGADINIKDDNRQTCIQCISKKGYFRKEVFKEYIRLLQSAGVYIDDINIKICIKDYTDWDVQTKKQKMNDKLKKLIDPTFTADYFFSEKFVMDYKKMPKSQREAIHNFYTSIELFNFEKLRPIIMLQFGKARTRTRLYGPAESAFQALIHKNLPDCLEFIFDHLNNDDLMNLIRAGNGQLVFAPLSENF